MKKVIFLSLILISSFLVGAQENNEKLYLMFEFMQVADENNSDYWEVEQFWSEIHKQRVANQSIVGWDLWSLTPSGSMQGSQYMTVTLFSSLQGMFEGIGNFNEILKKAHPTLKENELDAMMEKTVNSRDIAHQVYFKRVDVTEGDFNMEIGTIMTMDIMKQKDDQYEKIEAEIFKPWHQKQVDAGEKGNWGLIRALLPAGSESYASHITYSMYKNVAQLTEFWEGSGTQMDLMTELAVKKGLETRDRKEVKVARLIMKVR